MTKRHNDPIHPVIPSPAHPVILKARWLFPVSSDPIADGAVTIEAGRIVAVGKARAGAAVEDLGNVAILPGLVNAHVHLEFSDLAMPLGARGMSLVDWIREVIAFRRGPEKGTGTSRAPSGGWSRSQSPLPPAAPEKGTGTSGTRSQSPVPPDAVRRGLEESLRCGTTTIGEIAQPDWSLEPFVEAGVRAVVFLELIAPTSDRVEAAAVLAQRHLETANLVPGFHPGLSPHAPYSVHPALLRRVVELSRERSVPVAVHLAESAEELLYLRHDRGPFAVLLWDLLESKSSSLERLSSPLDYLHELAPAHRSLIVHGNYLNDEEIAFLARHLGQMSLIYCPRTHDYFGRDPYPLEKSLAAGVLVALGTDSRASAPDLSVLEEMRFVAQRHPSVPRSTVLRMGTLNGARALGLEAECGSLEPDKRADLAIVPLPNRDAADPHELLFDSDEPVRATWLGGTITGGRGTNEK